MHVAGEDRRAARGVSLLCCVMIDSATAETTRLRVHLRDFPIFISGTADEGFVCIDGPDDFQPEILR